MIKGVNKRIVEVTNTNNKYFYKALLFVNTDCADMSDRKIENEANKYLNRMFLSSGQKPGYLRKRRKIKRNVLYSLLFLSIGIAAVVFFALFH